MRFVDTTVAREADQSPEPYLDPTKPGFWHGMFFPNPCGDSSEFERTGRTFVLAVDYLPTVSAVKLAEDYFGEPSKAVLDRWLHLWKTVLGGDVDEFVARAAPEFRESPEQRWARLLASGASELARGPGWARHASSNIFDALYRWRPEQLRHPAHHVMQDAVRHLALVREGTPFALCLDAKFDGRREGLVFVPNGDGGMRLAAEGTATSKAALSTLYAASRAHNPYWTLKAFRERAGRPMAVATGVRHLVMTLLDMAVQGHTKAFVKKCATKAGTWVLDLAASDDASSLLGRVRVVLGSGMEGGAGFNVPRFLVQGHVPFVREHRFLVVRHRVVSSTASDRNLNVIHAVEGPVLGKGVARLERPAFEQGRYDRGESVREVNRKLLAGMALGARDLARAMRREIGSTVVEHDRFDCYCVDMGQTEDGRVLPIEVNSLSGCGLYEADFWAVAKALSRRAERFSVQDEEADEEASSEPAPTDGLQRAVAPCRWGLRALWYTLVLNERTGWPIVGVHAEIEAGPDPSNEASLAFGVVSPDGKLVHGLTSFDGPASLVSSLDMVSYPHVRTSTYGQGYLCVPIERSTLLDILDPHVDRIHILGGGHEIDVDRFLEGVGWKVRRGLTEAILAEEGIEAFPSDPGRDCLDFLTEKFYRPRAEVLCIPPECEFEVGYDLSLSYRERLAVFLKKTGQERSDMSMDELGDHATPDGRDGDHWPLPVVKILGRDDAHGIAGLVPSDELARIVMALHVHTKRVRLVDGVVDWPPRIGLALTHQGKPSNRPDATPSDLWDLCTGYVICGYLPPKRLVVYALETGVVPELKPEVLEAVRRSFSLAKADMAKAEAMVLRLSDLRSGT